MLSMNVLLRLLPHVLFLMTASISMIMGSSGRPVHSKSSPPSVTCRLRIAVTIAAGILQLVRAGIKMMKNSSDIQVYISCMVPSFIAASHMTSALLLLHAARQGKVRSPVVWAYALMIFMAEGVRHSAFHVGLLHASEMEHAFSAVYLILSSIFLILCSITDHVRGGGGGKGTPAENPRSTCSIPSYFTFSWVDHLAITGWKRELQDHDLHQLVDENKAQHVGSIFRDNLGIRNDVALALMSTFRRSLALSAFLKITIDSLDFVNPLILKWLLDSLTPDRPEWEAKFIAILMLVTAVTYNVLQNLYLDICFVTGIRSRTALMSSIYQKSLVLSNNVRQEKSVGQIVNLMSKDADQFRILMEKLHITWAVWPQLVIAHVLLFREIGWSAFTGIVVVIILTPVTLAVTRIMKSCQSAQMRHKDERIKTMSEILSGIRVIKMSAWEQAFTDMITKIRNHEMRHIRMIAYMSSINTFTWNMTPVLVTLATFAVYLLSDASHSLDPGKIFYCITIFNILRITYKDLPKLFNSLISCRIACKRLDQFFASEEKQPYVRRDDDEKFAITITGASLAWDLKSEFLLHIQEMRIRKGSLVAIIGPVGSGKSSLLSAMLDQMVMKSGEITISSSDKQIAYVPQQACIFNDTIRNNILFGKDFDKKKYHEVLRACQLEADLMMLPTGDETEIGERGITLSGGQKQRISLARSCYADSDIVLLDDPLSAVDANVSSKIYDQVLSSEMGLLKDRTRILVTNDRSLLNRVDIVFECKNGMVSEIETIDTSESDKTSEVIVAPTEKKDCEKIQLNGTSNGCSNGDHNKIDKQVLIKNESKEKGGVKFHVLVQYFKQIPHLIPIIICLCLYQVFEAGGNYWLSQWSHNVTASDAHVIDSRLTAYAILGLASGMFLLMATLTLARGTVAASIHLHGSLLSAILKSPMSFFETTPIGRILNRFSKDTDVIDVNLFEGLSFLSVIILQVMGAFITISIALPAFIIVLIPLTLLFMLIQRINIATARQIRRMDSTTCSLIYAHFSETLASLPTISSFNASDRMTRVSEKLVDDNQVCTLAVCEMNRWRCFRLQFLGNLGVFFTAMFAVMSRNTIDAGLTGLAVTYALQVSKLLNWLVKGLSGTETDAVSLERVMEYMENEPEGDWLSSNPPPEDWPDCGRITLKDISVRYRPGLPPALSGFSAEIQSGEKIGIVGRTGAGKTTITACLLRLIEASTGEIIMDGIDCRKIGLHELRKQITIIPQEPVLFSGSLRRNLDPLGSESDDRIWDCLQKAHLKSFVSCLDGGLDHMVRDGGENLSVGQRQLVCLARALLRKNKILLMDEATAAVDSQTDSLIQNTIRDHFADCTVLTIAHRIHTVMQANRIIVMKDGRIVEFDSPQRLLANESSQFFALARHADMKRN